MLKPIMWLILSFSLIGCGKTFVVKNVYLPLPINPTFPAITKADHATCNKAVSNKIKKRDIIITGYSRTLKGIIDTNNKRAK